MYPGAEGDANEKKTPVSFLKRFYFSLNQFMTSKTFCILPWKHLFVGNSGRFFPCCMTEHQETYLCNPEHKELSAKKRTDWKLAFNSPQILEMRRQMLEGLRPEICQKCFTLEDQGNVSHRQVQNALFFNHYTQKQVDFSSGPRDLSEVLSLDLRPGNVCNLVCRMCNPETAMGWLAEWEKLYPGDLDEEEKKEYTKLDWFESFEINNFLGLKKLHFAGGEPFLCKEIPTLLKKLIKDNRAHEIHLSFNTNLTLIPFWVKETFPYFAGVQLMVSLDGIGLVNDYIRYPSKFSLIEKNLFYIDKNFDSLNLVEVNILSTIQLYNSFSLTDLFLFPKQFKSIKSDLCINYLFDPYPLSIQVLPSKIKDELTNRLNIFLENKSLSSQDIENIKSIIKFMNEKDLSGLFSEFCRFTNILDKSRKQRVQDFITELPQW